MKKSNFLSILFLIIFGFSYSQGPVKKKKSSMKLSNQKSNTLVEEHAVAKDSIKIINGRSVYIDQNGVQSFKVVN